MLNAGSRQVQIDDTNYSDNPFETYDLVNGKPDYKFTVDGDSNAVIDITAVLIQGENTTDFVKLDLMTIDDKDAQLVMSPNASASGGTPKRALEVNNTIFLDPFPNYAASAAGKIFYKRTPSYFIVSDTTKQPGFPTPFHEMLAVASSYDWLLVHKSNAQTLIAATRAELAKWEDKFEAYVGLRNPSKGRLTVKQESNR